MFRSGGPLALLALAALAAPALSAQTPTDLADVCKALGNAKVGQWASFEGTSASGGGKLRLAVVGSERASDSTLYWFEVNFAGHELGQAKGGQWAAFEGASACGGGKLRLAVVGSERASDSTLYWFEVNFAGQEPGKSGVVQI